MTVLRIIEREDKIDKKAETIKFNKGFSAPGRPKRWKEKAKEIFKNSISARYLLLNPYSDKHVNIYVDRFHMMNLEGDDDEQWLSDSLVKLEQAVLDELRCVKELCLPCFPPEFDILDFYIQNYHKGLVAMFDELSQHDLSYGNCAYSGYKNHLLDKQFSYLLYH